MKLLRAAWAVCGVLWVACGSVLPEQPDVSPSRTVSAQQSLHSKFLRVREGVPESYIVVLKDPPPGKLADVPGQSKLLVARYGGTVGHVYTSALQGFSVRMTEAQARVLAEDPSIAYVEEDAQAQADATQHNPPSWGLDRIDQATGLDNRYVYPYTGAGINVYVIDTGIRTTHWDFGGRASGAYTAILDGHGTDDCDGHGTAVAGTIGGANLGVAKQVQLFAVRVFGCSGGGPSSDIIAGVDWVRLNRVSPAVANMSLTIVGGTSSALDAAVQNLSFSGVAVVVGAGNDDVDACNRSPARLGYTSVTYSGSVLTVASIDSSGARSSYPGWWASNWGPCVSLFAPGSYIVSAGIASNYASGTFSGTSMAAPHVTGVVAQFLQQYPGTSNFQAYTSMLFKANDGVVSDTKTSPNKLVILNYCGNNICHGPGENSYNCPSDCGDVCGNGYCGTSESGWSCPEDCPGYCGDGICLSPNEGPFNCIDDCGDVCGNRYCGPTEDGCSCPMDCGFCPPQDP